MYIVKEFFNKETNLIICKNKTTNEIHTLVKLDNEYFDITSSFFYKDLNQLYDIIYEIPYSEVIWMTFYCHNNVGRYE